MSMNEVFFVYQPDCTDFVLQLNNCIVSRFWNTPVSRYKAAGKSQTAFALTQHGFATLWPAAPTRDDKAGCSCFAPTLHHNTFLQTYPHNTISLPTHKNTSPSRDTKGVAPAARSGACSRSPKALNPKTVTVTTSWNTLRLRSASVLLEKVESSLHSHIFLWYWYMLFYHSFQWFVIYCISCKLWIIFQCCA